MFNNKLKDKIKELETRIKVLEEANIMAGICVSTLTDVVKKLHNEALDKIGELTKRVNHLECKKEKKCTREKKSKK